MHFLAAVVIPPATTRTVDEHVTEALAPYEETYDEESDELTGWWDWWQIGGRWTGVWSDYEPESDPRNVEVCTLCGGSGTRPDGIARFGEDWARHCNGCNGCQGTGQSVKWSTSWASHDGDVISVEDFLANEDWQQPYRLVVPEFGAYAREEWDGEQFVKTDFDARKVLAPLAGGGFRLVVVDYHS